VKTLLENYITVEISCLPYSTDLMPTDFSIPYVKTALKGRKCQDAEDIKRNVTTNLNAVSLDTFHDCFMQFTG
jgi:hypothetical protein